LKISPKEETFNRGFIGGAVGGSVPGVFIAGWATGSIGIEKELAEVSGRPT
jgi:hypothetical protein